MAAAAPSHPSVLRDPEDVIAVVTGAGGMIGEAVMRALHTDGHEARPLQRNPQGRSWRLGDLAESSILEGASALIHLAWDLDPNNAGVCETGSFRLLEQCRQVNITRFVFVSSQSAVASKPTRYGAAKRAVEDALLAYKGALSVRPGLVWSDPPRGAFQRLVGARFLGCTLTVTTPEVLHPVHVDDLAAILARAAASPVPTGVLEVGAVRPVSAQSLVATALGPGRQVRVPRATLGSVAALLSLGGSRGRALADRARGLGALEPMSDPTMDTLGISCRELTRLEHIHG
jgi:nucleoside-diphosphate-sugar epimerase